MLEYRSTLRCIYGKVSGAMKMNGNTKYQGKVLKCTVCCKEISRAVLITAFHNQVGPTWEKEATADEEGSSTKQTTTPAQGLDDMTDIADERRSTGRNQRSSVKENEKAHARKECRRYSRTTGERPEASKICEQGPPLPCIAHRSNKRSDSNIPTAYRDSKH